MTTEPHHPISACPPPRRDGPRHAAAMLRRPRCGRRADLDAAPILRPQFTDWALI